METKLGGQGFQKFAGGGCFTDEMNLVNSLIKSIFIQQFFGRHREGGACPWHWGDRAC